MSVISHLVERIDTISSTLLFLEGRIKTLQAERSAAFLALDQLHSAQRDAYEHGWPGPTREAMEEARVAHRNARIDLAHAEADQIKFLADLGEAQGELQKAKLEAKRAARNQPLTTRPFAALLG